VDNKINKGAIVGGKHTGQYGLVIPGKSNPFSLLPPAIFN